MAIYYSLGTALVTKEEVLETRQAMEELKRLLRPPMRRAALAVDIRAEVDGKLAARAPGPWCQRPPALLEPNRQPDWQELCCSTNWSM